MLDLNIDVCDGQHNGRAQQTHWHCSQHCRTSHPAPIAQNPPLSPLAATSHQSGRWHMHCCTFCLLSAQALPQGEHTHSLHCTHTRHSHTTPAQPARLVAALKPHREPWSTISMHTTLLTATIAGGLQDSATAVVGPLLKSGEAAYWASSSSTSSGMGVTCEAQHSSTQRQGVSQLVSSCDRVSCRKASYMPAAQHTIPWLYCTINGCQTHHWPHLWGEAGNIPPPTPPGRRQTVLLLTPPSQPAAHPHSRS